MSLRTQAVLRTFLIGLLFACASTASAQNLGTPRVRRDIHGNVLMTGNVAVTCQAGTTNGGVTCANAQAVRANNKTDNNYNGQYVDVDNAAGLTGAATTTMSSMASLSLPATGSVRWAGLYWMCETNTAALTAARGNVSFQGPAGGGYTALTADQIMTGASNGGYLAFKDVTSRVSTSGNYWVGNMSCDQAGSTNHWGGWTLIVIYEDVTEPLRDLVVWDGSQSYQNTAINLNLTGFVTPFSPLVNRVTDIGLFIGDGDLAATDTLTLTSGALVTNLQDTSPGSTTTDVGNSTITTPYLPAQTLNPNYANTLGYDLDVIRLTNRMPNGATTATITALGSAADILAVGAITFSTNIYAPDLVSTKTAVDLNGGQLLPGDILEYTIHVVNNGLDAALNTQLVDNLPPFTSLDTAVNSIVLDGVNLTRVADGDSGVYDSILNRVTIGIGGATGRVNTNDVHDITLRVVLANNIPDGTNLQNQAQFVYNGETLGNAVSYNSLSDGSSTVAGSNPTDNPVVHPASVTVTDVAALTTDVDGQGDFDPGDTVTYTIVATNQAGSASATSVHLTSVIDTTRLQVVSLTTNTGSVASGTAPNLDVNVGTLAGGASATITLVARITRPFPAGVTSISHQWSATGSFTGTVLSDDPGTGAANDPTVISPIQASCGCFVSNVCYASGAANPLNSCTSCQPAVSGTAFSPVVDGTVCGGTGSCHAGNCCLTCWNGSSCVPGPVTCGTVCGDGALVAGEECDDGANANGDGCSSTCTVEGGFSCSGILPNVCVPNVTIVTPVNGSSTSNTTPSITGTGPAGATLTVTEGASTLCTTAVTAGGTWSCTSSALALGGHTIVAHTTGPTSGAVGLSLPDNFTIIPPCGDGTRIASEQCDDGNTNSGDGCSSACVVEAGFSCTGASPGVCTANVTITTPANGSSTSDTTPDIGGTGPALSTVTVTEGAATLCTTTATAAGTWSCTSSVLTLGGHTVVANTTGPGAGQLGLSQPDSFTIIPPCGDSIVGAGETCDDGNNTDGDGCSSTCAVEAGSSCAGAGPSVCTAGVIAITTPANGSQTSDTTPDVSGSAKPNSTVTVFEGASLLCTTTATAAGAWTCTSSVLTLGGHTVFARSSGPNAGDNALSTNDSFTIIPPCGDGTRIASEQCDDGNTNSGDGCSSACVVEAGFSCTGASPGVCTANVTITTPADGSSTSDTTPDIGGTGPAGSTVTVTEGAATLCTATATAGGTWSCTSSVLTLGGHTVVANTTGPGAGDLGLSLPDSFTIIPPCGDSIVGAGETCDDGNNTDGDGCSSTCAVEAGSSCAGAGPSVCSTGVIAITTPANGSQTSDTTPDVGGTAKPGSTVTVFEGASLLCTTTATAAGAWTCTSSVLTLGGHTVFARSSGPNAGDNALSTNDSFTIIVPCGDGTLAVGEECDDGNTSSSDGCSSACVVEAGFSCTGASPGVCTANVTITAPVNGSSTSDTTPPISGTGVGSPGTELEFAL